MGDKYNDAKEILRKYNQKHVIPFLNFPDGKINDNIVDQVLKIDFEELKELYNKTFEDLYVDLEQLQPIAGVNPDRLTNEELQKYEEVGANIIKNNKFAVGTMAGRTGN